MIDIITILAAIKGDSVTIMRESDGNESQQICKFPKEIEKAPVNAEALVHLRVFFMMPFKIRFR